MNWIKKGLIFSPSGEGGWMRSHAQVPTPLLLGDVIRVYFSSRPEQGMSLTTFLDLDAKDPSRVLRVNSKPILELGKPGTFDEHGIMPSCAVEREGRVYLYYSGWSRSVGVPYTNSTGLAVSEDGGVTFQRVCEGPILGRHLWDPYSATSPWVLWKSGVAQMWYCAGTGWVSVDGKQEHVYDIKHAMSTDGLRWQTERRAAVAQRHFLEALTRPCVLQVGAWCHMWFCYRGSESFRDGPQAYRIGHAVSSDCDSWVRRSETALAPSVEGWDSRMVAYPAVLRVNDRLIMFYNGNGFGVEGFGWADCAQTAG